MRPSIKEAWRDSWDQTMELVLVAVLAVVSIVVMGGAWWLLAWLI